MSRGRQADGKTGLYRRRQPDAVPESALRSRAVHAGRSRRAMRPAAAGAAAVCAQAFDQVILGCVNVIADEMNPARVAALRLGMGEKMVAFTVQINCGSGMQSIDTAYRYIREGVSDLDSGGWRRGAEPRAAGVAATGRALVCGPCGREGHRRKNHGRAEGEAELFQADHRAGARTDRSHHRTQHGPDRRSGRASLWRHPRAVGRLCRRKPQAAGEGAIGRLAQGRGRNRVRARRKILRSRRRRAAGFDAGEPGETEAGVRAPVGQGHGGEFLADHRRRVLGDPRLRRGCGQARPDAEGGHSRQPVVGARSRHHGPGAGAVGKRAVEAQRADACPISRPGN